jgi:ABC-2 type transport system permease protein
LTIALAPPATATLSAIRIIWKREILRWWRNKARIIGSLGFPLMFLFVFGSGLSRSMGSLAGSAANIDFEQFIFPGVIAMNVFFAAIFNGISLVYDREFGLLKEVLVAPVSRSAIAFGKTLGGATVATVQGTLVFVFAPLVGVRLTPMLVLKMWPLMFVAAFALAAMGVAMAARMGSTESFQLVNQFVTFPLMFLSGIFFPLQGLPAWMNAVVKVNPISYAVDPLRRLVLEAQQLPQSVLANLDNYGLGISVGGHQMSLWEDVVIVVGFGLLMNLVAMWLVSRQD